MSGDQEKKQKALREMHPGYVVDFGDQEWDLSLTNEEIDRIKKAFLSAFSGPSSNASVASWTTSTSIEYTPSLDALEEAAAQLRSLALELPALRAGHQLYYDEKQSSAEVKRLNNLADKLEGKSIDITGEIEKKYGPSPMQSLYPVFQAKERGDLATLVCDKLAPLASWLYERISKHPQPNAHGSWLTLLSSAIVQMEMYGVMYLWEPGPGEVWLLESPKLSAVRDAKGSLVYYYQEKPTQSVVTIPSERVVSLTLQERNAFLAKYKNTWLPDPNAYIRQVLTEMTNSVKNICTEYQEYARWEKTYKSKKAEAKETMLSWLDERTGSGTIAPPAQEDLPEPNKKSKESEKQVKEISSSIMSDFGVSEEGCPQGHHLKDGPCDYAYCYCPCARCKFQCEARGR